MAYFSNSAEANIVWKQCAKCRLSENTCPIELAQMMYNYEAKENKTATDILDMIVSSKTGCQLFASKRRQLDKTFNQAKSNPSEER